MKYVKAYLAFFFFNVIVASVMYIWFQTYLVYLVAEDGLIENLSAAFFLLSFFLSVASLIKRKGDKKILIPISALGLIGFLDELGFGVRIFGFSVPHFGGMEIGAAHDFLRLLSDDTYIYLLGAIFAVFIIVLFTHRSKLVNAVLGMLQAPHYILLLCFVLLGFFALLIDLEKFGFKPLFVLEEILEMNAAMALCFTCLSLANSRAVVLVTVLVLTFLTGILTLTASPSTHTLYFYSGVGYQKRGQYDRAISDYSRVIEIEPNHVGTYFNRGIAYQSKGQYDQAISDFAKVIDTEPDHAGAYYNRGIAYQSKGQYDSAISDFTKTIEMDPGHAGAYNNRGVAYQRKGAYDLSISDHTRAIEMNPDFAEAYNNRGLVFYLKGQYDKARSDVEKAIALGCQIHPGFLKALDEASVRGQKRP